MTKNLQGILSAVATPMDKSGESIDEAAFVRLLEAQVAGGVHGVVVAGSTGEHSTLTTDERKRLCELAVKTVKGRVTIITQVGATNTRTAVELAQHAVATGTDRLMAVPPYYDRLRWADLERFLAEVAEVAQGPIVYYHTPRVTGLDLTEDQLCSLCQSGYISHVKDSAADFARTRRLMSNPNGPIVLAGTDPAMMSLLIEGAAGSILGASTFIPELCVELYDAVKTKSDLAAAQSAWRRLWPILNHLLLSGYVATAKAGMELRGLAAGVPRRPLLPAEPDVIQTLSELLTTAGIARRPKTAGIDRAA